MSWASSEYVEIIAYLLPGFVAAWVFHGLTAHPKSTPFERIVQALIFTAICQASTAIIRGILLLAGKLIAFGVWTSGVSLTWSVVLAFVVGTGFAYFANHNSVHAWLARWNFTRRTSYPSEWFSAFSQHGRRYLVLHLADGRRIHGWPEEWPDQPDSGQFILANTAWILQSNELIQTNVVHRMIVPATEVRFVELQKYPNEVDANEDDIRASNDALTRLWEKESD